MVEGPRENGGQEQYRRCWELGVIVLAAGIALVGIRPYAGSWNDGGRLATIEALVDYHTLAIDQSIFVQVPPQTDPNVPGPYGDERLLQQGTGDKLWIGGKFYSHHSPVPAVLLAGVYQGLQWATGLTARARPDWFCFAMTLASSGLAYVVSVWCIFRLGGLLQLPVFLRLFLTASFATATVAPAYERQVNNHILLLAVTALLLMALVHVARRARAAPLDWPRLLWVGSLAGLGYTIDLGAGPILLCCTLGLIAYRHRRIMPVLAVSLAALPWLVLYHALNYQIGGTFRPAAAVPEYLEWPGSLFHPDNMTGVWNHHTLQDFLTYAGGLLLGERGFLGHNLPLFLALPGVVILAGRRVRELPEVLFAVIFCTGTWLAYAGASNNYSGSCCSIRWFVPFLAPAYFILAVLVRDDVIYRRAFFVLTAFGVLFGAIMWYRGPWYHLTLPYFWTIQIEGLACAFIVGYWCYRQQQARAWQRAVLTLAQLRARRPIVRRRRVDDSSDVHHLTPVP